MSGNQTGVLLFNKSLKQNDSPQAQHNLVSVAPMKLRVTSCTFGRLCARGLFKLD